MQAGFFWNENQEETGRETVADMRLLVRAEFKKDWFTHHESKIIVDLLVKTQGLESENSVASKKEAGNESQKDSKQ